MKTKCTFSNIFNIFNICQQSVLASSAVRIVNSCINVNSDGTIWGYKHGVIGSADPDETTDGTLFYQFTTDDSGNMELRFGSAGDIRLTDVDEIYIEDKYFNETNIFVWDDTLKAYALVDAEYGQKIRDEFTNIGEFEMCMGMYVLPLEFIHYTFAQIEEGDA
jgi:hypothetical protein